MDIYAAPEKVTQEDRFGFEHSRGLLGLISPRHAVHIKTIKAVEGKEYEDPEKVRQALVKRMGKSFTITIENGKSREVLEVKLLKNLMSLSRPQRLMNTNCCFSLMLRTASL